MRVLHVFDVSAPMIAGYASRSRSLVNAQRALGVEPVVLTSVRHQNPHAELEEIDGLRHYRTLQPQPPARRIGLEIYHLSRRILEVARRERVDLIHGHSPIMAGIPAWLAARRLGLPVVYEIRSLWEDAAAERGATHARAVRYRATRRAETWLASHVDALVCICEALRTEFVDRGLPSHRVHVVPNGVDTERFVPRAPDPSVRARYHFEGKTVVAYIGSFFAFEGVPLLIEALCRLIRDRGRDDIRGLIVGSGPTYAQCQAIAARAGLADKVLHLGAVPHEAIAPLYSVTDILAYPRTSLRLTELVTPLKPLEAMAMEKAVIGSNVGGLRELIDDDVTGLIHRHDDVEDLAATILRLVEDEPLRRRLGGAGRAWVQAERRWDLLARRYLEIYERISGS